MDGILGECAVAKHAHRARERDPPVPILELGERSGVEPGNENDQRFVRAPFVDASFPAVAQTWGTLNTVVQNLR